MSNYILRSRHGFLTSEEIRARRKRLGQSQREFALHTGVGLATIKRAEMGKIQDRHTDEAIRRKTDVASRLPTVHVIARPVMVTSTNSTEEWTFLGDTVQLANDNSPFSSASPYLANLLMQTLDKKDRTWLKS